MSAENRNDRPLQKEKIVNRILQILAALSAIALVAVCNRTAALPPDRPPPTGPALDPKPEDPNRLKLPTRKETMAMKLKGSQAILEGIALEDFDKIRDASKELVSVGNATDFLNAYKGAEYQFHTLTFRRSAEAISKKAKERNMDGVMVAYNELTLSCLKCHQAMRERKFEINLDRRDDTRPGK
jgi:hypothetical protein